MGCPGPGRAAGPEDLGGALCLAARSSGRAGKIWVALLITWKLLMELQEAESFLEKHSLSLSHPQISLLGAAAMCLVAEQFKQQKLLSHTVPEARCQASRCPWSCLSVWGMGPRGEALRDKAWERRVCEAQTGPPGL